MLSSPRPKDRSSKVAFEWNDNLVLYYREKLMQGWQLWSAHQTVPDSAIAGITDTVRTRVLNMALEKSDIGEEADLKTITPEESRKVDHTIVTNIFGGNVFMSGGSSSMSATAIQQQQQNIVAGDWHHLESAMKNVGVNDVELRGLSAAMQSDGDQKLKDGSAVMNWIKAQAPKVLSGGVKMGAEVGKAVLTEMLMQYCGLKPL